MNCKPGDLAIVVGECMTPGIRGRIVEVIRFVGGQFEGRTVDSNRKDCWEIKAAGGGNLPQYFTNGIVVMVPTRPFSDSQLRPISGVPVHDKEYDEVPA